MPALLLKLVPFRDWLYAGIAVAAVIWFLHHDHVERQIGATAVTTAVNAATQKTLIAAKAQLDAQDKQYAGNLAKVSATYETQLSTATAQHGADLQRLREYDAYRHSHPDTNVGGTGTAGSDTDGGAASAGDVGSNIEGAALGLADALRLDDAQLQLCWTERDSLTGK